ncbi:MAG TPA: NAD(P)/FAD-dependent oxidoreductase [Alphaproteobacteria bacterium]|nr:NAD(P)/FAD-dependent oxidoreductase [Alphaproteobacteria bacterium]
MDSAAQTKPASAAPDAAGVPRVVIVGAGFGGLAVATGLARAPVEVTVIDRRNDHLFQPLLYQVATAALSPAEIAWPIRSILRNQKNTTVLLGRATGVDVAGRAVLLADGRRLAYDFLVLATGARHAYFGHDDWEAFAPGLKKIDDATEIRRRILLAFERAEVAENPAEHERLLTFVIVGGGPTGVELAGTLAELARKALAADFRHIDSRETRVILAEAGPRILPSFPESLSRIAEQALARLGVETRLGHPVTAVDAQGVEIDGARIPAATVLWAAGVAASPAGKWLGAERDRAGRIKVQADMSVPGHPEIFAIGDTVLALGRDGAPLPGVAPVAKQQGSYVARVIKARLAGKPAPKPFRYINVGNLATVGRRAAVIDFGVLRLSGWLAWWMWGIVHIYFLIGMRNRLIVAIHWLWSYITFQRGARLITGADS